jgi:lipopolysaccharide/colanic/teichoic acid biosynthesis glycosyltransferase
MSSDMAKRAFDVGCCFVLLPLLSPVLLASAIAVAAGSRGPVLYRGVRVGRYGRQFRILKFRSMVVNAEKLGGSATANDDARLTRAGRLLRKYKLDELPQLINVLVGDMSLVGPRPEVPKYVAMYSEQEQAILSVRPGITDWASIWNADEGSVLAGSPDPERTYEQVIRPTKLQLQLFYVRNRSLTVDLRILTFTVLRLFRVDRIPQELASYPSLQ